MAEGWGLADTGASGTRARAAAPGLSVRLPPGPLLRLGARDRRPARGGTRPARRRSGRTCGTPGRREGPSESPTRPPGDWVPAPPCSRQARPPGTEAGWGSTAGLPPPGPEEAPEPRPEAPGLPRPLLPGEGSLGPALGLGSTWGRGRVSGGGIGHSPRAWFYVERADALLGPGRRRRAEERPLETHSPGGPPSAPPPLCPSAPLPSRESPGS